MLFHNAATSRSACSANLFINKCEKESQSEGTCTLVIFFLSSPLFLQEHEQQIRTFELNTKEVLYESSSIKALTLLQCSCRFCCCRTYYYLDVVTMILHEDPLSDCWRPSLNDVIHLLLIHNKCLATTSGIDSSCIVLFLSSILEYILNKNMICHI